VPQEVFVVELELFEAGPGDVCELEFHFLRGAARLAALGDILDPASCSLHHLVVGPAALADVAVTKPDRHIVTKLRDLEALELPVSSMFRNQWLHN